MPAHRPIFNTPNQRNKNHSGNFMFLQMQVAHWQKLTQVIQPILPADGNWQVVYYQQGLLRIIGNNQALVSQVRYLKQNYIAQLKAIATFQDLTDIQVDVQNTNKQPVKKYTEKKSLSNETQQLLTHASNLVSHSKLSQALQRLAQQQDDKNKIDLENQ